VKRKNIFIHHLCFPKNMIKMIKSNLLNKTIIRIVENKAIQLMLCLGLSFQYGFGQNSPMEIAQKVANRVIDDSSFSYYTYLQEQSSFVQTIDFGDSCESGDMYAFSYLLSSNEKEATLGISSKYPVSIWLNGALVFKNTDGGNPNPREIAYGMHEFENVFKTALNQGENSILIKSIAAENSKINLAAILEDGFRDRDITFTLEPLLDRSASGTAQNWIIAGPIIGQSTIEILTDKIFPPETGFRNTFQLDDKIYNWQTHPRPLLLGVQIPDHAGFQRHPYTEWHYSNGATMWSMLRLAEAAGETRYSDFVQKFCEFTLDDLEYFNYQYHELNEYSGHNSRVFRLSMLDDSSAPALPFLHLYSQDKLPQAWPLIEKAARQASEEQYRLDDNTLCRPEPVRWSIWADDLFMYVPFILKYAEITGKNHLVDDAIHQALMFHKYLFDETKGLYYHGWFSDTGEHSIANWSRANGWVTWAMSELLREITPKHRNYRELRRIHKQHLDGLLKYQHESGLWHQVLDHPDTYLETSGTALFAIALARGVNDGWLGRKYKNVALKAWEGVTSRIEENGTVTGICQGTGIGETIEFYQNRLTPPHDPRGLGAIITAGIEIQRMID
jgi:unsaturated rhamnogalacturonyl hydrolase